MIVKTVFPCDVSIRRNLCLKLQKIDKGDGHKRRKLLRRIGVSKIGLRGEL